MERKPNQQIKSYRDTLHARYHAWNHTEKAGLEHLPENADIEDMKKIKIRLQEEMQQLDSIRTCCDYLIEEIQKDWIKL